MTPVHLQFLSSLCIRWWGHSWQVLCYFPDPRVLPEIQEAQRAGACGQALPEERPVPAGKGHVCGHLEPSSNLWTEAECLTHELENKRLNRVLGVSGFSEGVLKDNWSFPYAAWPVHTTLMVLPVPTMVLSRALTSPSKVPSSWVKPWIPPPWEKIEVPIYTL